MVKNVQQLENTVIKLKFKGFDTNNLVSHTGIYIECEAAFFEKFIAEVVTKSSNPQMLVDVKTMNIGYMGMKVGLIKGKFL